MALRNLLIAFVLTPCNKNRKETATEDNDVLLSSHSFALTHLANGWGVKLLKKHSREEVCSCLHAQVVLKPGAEPVLYTVMQAEIFIIKNTD